MLRELIRLANGEVDLSVTFIQSEHLTTESNFVGILSHQGHIKFPSNVFFVLLIYDLLGWIVRVAIS